MGQECQGEEINKNFKENECITVWGKSYYHISLAEAMLACTKVKGQDWINAGQPEQILELRVLL